MEAKSQEHLPLTESVFYILLALQKPRHGYGIMQFVEKMSNKRVHLGPGTLYGALKTLQEKNWIELISTDNQTRKKEYIITEIGKVVIQLELERLEELLANGKKVLKGEFEE
mgnify:CR=1 FL=1